VQDAGASGCEEFRADVAGARNFTANPAVVAKKSGGE